MEHLIKLLIGFAAVLVIARLYWLFRHRWRQTHATDIEIIWSFQSESNYGFHGITFEIPSYSADHKAAHISTMNTYASSEDIITGMIGNLVGESQLVQIMAANCLLPSREYLYDQGMRPFQSGVTHTHQGALIYSPEAIRKGALTESISNGFNIFLICSRDYEKLATHIQTIFSKVADSDGQLDYDEDFGPLDIEGYITQEGPVVNFVHRDPAKIEDMVNRILGKAYSDLFSLNRLDFPKGVRFPGYHDLIMEQNSRCDMPSMVQIYFEEGDVVTYMLTGKKWNSNLTKIPAGRIPLSTYTSPSWVRRWLIPQIVSDRAYKRKSLFRFALQYFCAAFYLVGLIAMLIYCSETILGDFPDILFQIPSLICGFLVILSLIMSLSYLSRAVFGGHRLLRPGL